MSNSVLKIGTARHDKLFPALRKKPKYPFVPGNEFCGTAPGTYPVDTIEHARAALLLAHYDPHPEKVRACALRRLKALNATPKADKAKAKRKVKK